MIRRKTMASKPLCRLDPSPRSFAADAHDCIMVTILPDRPNTRLWRVLCARWRAPLGIVVACPSWRLARPTEPAAVLVTVKGKSLRDGLRPPLTVTARGGQSKLRSGRGDGPQMRSNKEME